MIEPSEPTLATTQQILPELPEFAPHPEAENSNKLLPILQAVIMLFSWASGFPFIQLCLKNGINPGGLASLRYTLAVIFILPFFFKTSKRVPLAGKMPLKGDWWRFAVCGLLGFSLYNLLLNIGETTLSASASCLLNCAAPIFAAFIGIFFLKENMTLFGWIGAGVALCGVAIVSLSSGELSASNLQGPLVLLLSCLLTAIFTILQRPLIQRYGSMCALAWMVFFGALFLLPWLPRGLIELSHAPIVTYWNIMVLSLFTSVLGYACWASLVGRLGAANACILLYAEPPMTIIFSIFLTGEKLTPGILIGGSIVLSGMITARLRPVRNAPIFRRRKKKKKQLNPRHHSRFHHHRHRQLPEKNLPL